MLLCSPEPCRSGSLSTGMPETDKGAVMRTTILWQTAAALFAVIAIAAGQQPTSDETKEGNLKAYVDLLRKDVKKEKVSILTELMDLGPEDSAKFWPVYNEFDKSLTVLADERLALIRLYAETYG